MANSLLDFVMSLVRDPETAARYAADPAQAIADAHLTDVTSVDVQNLLPVVSESLSMAGPLHGVDVLGVEPATNVWASGEASAAFDAFDGQLPERAVIDLDESLPDIVEAGDPDFEALTGTELVDTGASLHFDVPLLDDAAAPDTGLDNDWVPPLATPDPGDPISGFDLFD